MPHPSPSRTSEVIVKVIEIPRNLDATRQNDLPVSVTIKLLLPWDSVFVKVILIEVMN